MGALCARATSPLTVRQGPPCSAPLGSPSSVILMTNRSGAAGRAGSTSSGAISLPSTWCSLPRARREGTGIRDTGKERMFSVLTDLDLLRQKVSDVANIRMIQIDPISAYFGVGKIDSFRNTDVRALLSNSSNW
jgi:hypothetical protein